MRLVVSALVSAEPSQRSSPAISLIIEASTTCEGGFVGAQEGGGEGKLSIMGTCELSCAAVLVKLFPGEGMRRADLGLGLGLRAKADVPDLQDDRAERPHPKQLQAKQFLSSSFVASANSEASAQARESAGKWDMHMRNALRVRVRSGRAFE